MSATDKARDSAGSNALVAVCIAYFVLVLLCFLFVFCVWTQRNRIPKLPECRPSSHRKQANQLLHADTLTLEADQDPENIPLSENVSSSQAH